MNLDPEIELARAHCMLEYLVEAGALENATYQIQLLESGGFKVPFKISTPTKAWFLSFGGSDYESSQQQRLSALLPRMFPAVYSYGTYEDRHYSLEEWYDLLKISNLPVGKFDPFHLAYAFGQTAGALFSRTKEYSPDREEDLGLVQFDPENIQCALPLERDPQLVCLDMGYLGPGNLHDLVGVFTDRCVGESDVALTLEYPEDFLRGVADSTGISLALLQQIRTEVPTPSQYAHFLCSMG